MGLCGVCRPSSKTKSFTDHNVDRLKSYHTSQSKSYVNFKIANALTMSGFMDRPNSNSSISNGSYLLPDSNIPGSSTKNATRMSRVDVTRQKLRNVKRNERISKSIRVNGMCETVSDSCSSSISVPTDDTGLAVSPGDVRRLRMFRAKVMKKHIGLKKRLLLKRRKTYVTSCNALLTHDNGEELLCLDSGASITLLKKSALCAEY